MRIHLNTLQAGPKGVRQPGEHDLPELEAKALIAGGHAKALPDRAARATELLSQLLSGKQRQIETREGTTPPTPATTEQSDDEQKQTRNKPSRSMRLGNK